MPKVMLALGMMPIEVSKSLILKPAMPISLVRSIDSAVEGGSNSPKVSPVSVQAWSATEAIQPNAVPKP